MYSIQGVITTEHILEVTLTRGDETLANVTIFKTPIRMLRNDHDHIIYGFTDKQIFFVFEHDSKLVLSIPDFKFNEKAGEIKGISIKHDHIVIYLNTQIALIKYEIIDDEIHTVPVTLIDSTIPFEQLDTISDIICGGILGAIHPTELKHGKQYINMK